MVVIPREDAAIVEEPAVFSRFALISDLPTIQKIQLPRQLGDSDFSRELGTSSSKL